MFRSQIALILRRVVLIAALTLSLQGEALASRIRQTSAPGTLRNVTSPAGESRWWRAIDGRNWDAAPLRWGNQGKRRGLCVLGGDLRGRSGFRFKVALAISAGGNFGRPLITVDRGDRKAFAGSRAKNARDAKKPDTWSRNHRRHHGLRIGRAIPCHSCHSVPLCH
jgi:hypothetical protein